MTAPGIVNPLAQMAVTLTGFHQQASLPKDCNHNRPLSTDSIPIGSLLITSFGSTVKGLQPEETRSRIDNYGSLHRLGYIFGSAKSHGAITIFRGALSGYHDNRNIPGTLIRS